MESVIGRETSKYKYLTDQNHSSSTTTTTTLGFMELLGIPVPDISPSLLFHDDDDVINNFISNYKNDEYFLTNTSLDSPAPDPLSSIINPPLSSRLLNVPATPNNCSSFSSASASNDDVIQDHIHSPMSQRDEEEHQQHPKKQTKPKKTNVKREREPRIAFMTRSQVDHLEDGFRWRKYGQKAVKNSPFPRGYYRCTSASCNVKKRVERLLTDPSIVVTTYEGQHTHPCTTLPRGIMSMGGFGQDIGATTSPYMLPTQMSNSTSFSHHLQMNYVNSSSPHLDHFGNMPSPNSSNSCPSLSAQDRRGATPVNAAALNRDNGLLQDIVPSIMKKEDQ